MNDAKRWNAVLRREGDAQDSFVYAVKSTHIFCRPGCPSRKPNRDNVVFFDEIAEAEKAGFRACLRCRPKDTNPSIVEAVCRHIDEHLDGPLTLAALSKFSGLSPFHLQRTFKRAMGVSPREYASAQRASRLKTELAQGRPVTEALYDAGYSSSSRLYERSGDELGMTPGAYRRGGQGERIDYAIADSLLGRMLVASTGKGICSITFGDSDEALEATLHSEFPAASFHRNQEALSEAVQALLGHLEGSKQQLGLPLDIRATAFQRQVWKALQAIPYGTTCSYSDVAQAIGKPDAVRAVASACAKNRIAVAIPCHRVLHKDGGVSGYRWGVERKKKLLEGEQR